MVDMAKTPEELKENKQTSIAPTTVDQSIYPYGLCISLTHEELEKLNLEPDCQVGDMIHIMAMAKVTSISQYETAENTNCRIELQITHLGLEDEDMEDEEESSERSSRKIDPNKFYRT